MPRIYVTARMLNILLRSMAQGKIELHAAFKAAEKLERKGFGRVSKVKRGISVVRYFKINKAGIAWVSKQRMPTKPTIVISYPLRQGGSVRDSGLWMGTLNGEVWDYNPKDELKAAAKKHGFAWVVMRRRQRDARFIVVERSS